MCDPRVASRCAGGPDARRSPAAVSPELELRALDLDQFGISQNHNVIDQSCRRFAEHHPTRRRGRLHALRHADLLTDRGVTRIGRADFAGDHLTRVQPDPQQQLDAVTVVDLGGQLGVLGLNLQRRHACPKSVILQRNRGAEYRHDAVAGELVYRSAVALHHRCRAVEQVAHDLAQPLGTHRRMRCPSNARRRRTTPSPACTRQASPPRQPAHRTHCRSWWSAKVQYRKRCTPHPYGFIPRLATLAERDGYLRRRSRIITPSPVRHGLLSCIPGRCGWA